mgnify:CR=1 FL=1
MKRWLIISLTCGALLIAVWAALFFMRPVAIVAAAKRGKAVHAVPGSVAVRAEFVSEIKSEVSGRVVASALEVGRNVNAGDVLMRLDTGDVDLEIERLRNEIAAARRRVEAGSPSRAELANTRETVAHLERQLKAGTYPQIEYDKAVRSLEQLARQVELEEANLQLALQNLETSLRAKEREREKMTLRAPISGVVNDVVARNGDLIAANSPVAVLISHTRVVEAKLSEENLAAVRVGQRASIRFLAYGGHQFDGTVARILPAADPETQRYTVWLDVTLPGARPLLPGLTGEVSIIIDARSNAVVVPRSAVAQDQVLVVRDGRLEARKVTVGYMSLNEVEILEGVDEGEFVVVGGANRLSEGDRVRMQPFETAR